jgi:electron transfer flavoprotein beta subunit
MEILACVKRVPDTGSKIVLTEDNQGIDTSNLGFTMSPHEECAVEESIQLAQDHEGTATALTLGQDEATEQVRTALAMQADEGVLLETDGSEWSAIDTAQAIAEYVRDRTAEGREIDLLLFGNESADAANYQVGVRVATELDLPCVTGIKSLEIDDTNEDGNETIIAKREVSGGSEVYEVPLPAVITVKEGLNSPRYPSIRSKMAARDQEIERSEPERTDATGLETIQLETPEQDEGTAKILGEGPEAVDDVIDVLANDLEVI